MFYGCGLVSWDVPLEALTNGYWMFAYCDKLKEFNVGLPKLSSGINMFTGAGLEADAINGILESLPSYTDGSTHKITFTGCPGAALCDTSIGTAKGWTVEV